MKNNKKSLVIALFIGHAQSV